VTRRLGGLAPGAGQMCGGPQRCAVCGASYQATVEVHACPGKKHTYEGEFPDPCRRCKCSASHAVHFDPFPPANPVPGETPEVERDLDWLQAATNRYAEVAGAEDVHASLYVAFAAVTRYAALLRPAATEGE